MKLRTLFLTAVLLLLLPTASPANEAQLKPHTLEAFLRYTQATEAEFLEQVNSDRPFLRLDDAEAGGLSADDRREAREELADGEVYTKKLRHIRDDAGEEIKAKNGIIHHWYAVVLVPGATLQQTLDLVQAYDNHKNVYNPEVEDAYIVDRNGNEFDIFYRWRKKKVITVVLATEHHVEYFPLPDGLRTYSVSKSTAVRQVDNAGKDDEVEQPPDEGRGFMWRVNSYWRFIEKEDGTYIECESVSLSRDIPFALRPLISPFVNGVPEELLKATLENTRRELVDRANAQQGQSPPFP